ncbi:MAG: sugar ABC transporter permease, partial [Acidobacteria bacterium]|nr:sugar ABC transporter permease [Acidobacteriota bacterium]
MPFFFLFFAVPTVAALFLSVTDFDIYALADIRNLRFVGLDNYASLVGRPLFWTAMGNTLWFVLFGVPLTVAA